MAAAPAVSVTIVQSCMRRIVLVTIEKTVSQKSVFSGDKRKRKYVLCLMLLDWWNYTSPVLHLPGAVDFAGYRHSGVRGMSVALDFNLG